MIKQVEKRIYKSLAKVCTDLNNVNSKTDLFSEAVLDSIETIEFIETLELEFGLKLDETIMFDKDFSTIKGIVKIIKKSYV